MAWPDLNRENVLRWFLIALVVLGSIYVGRTLGLGLVAKRTSLILTLGVFSLMAAGAGGALVILTPAAFISVHMKISFSGTSFWNLFRSWRALRKWRFTRP